jgi:hypothetical protein
MASVNQTRPHCINQMGKTHSKTLSGTAWAWHGHGMLCVNRPLGCQETKAPRISGKLTNGGGKVDSLRHRPPLPSRRYNWSSFLSQAESTIVRLEGLSQGKHFIEGLKKIMASNALILIKTNQ